MRSTPILVGFSQQAWAWTGLFAKHTLPSPRPKLYILGVQSLQKIIFSTLVCCSLSADGGTVDVQTQDLLHTDAIQFLQPFISCTLTGFYCSDDSPAALSNHYTPQTESWGHRNEMIKTGTEAQSISRLRSLSNSNVRRSRPRHKKVVPCVF